MGISAWKSPKARAIFKNLKSCKCCDFIPQVIDTENASKERAMAIKIKSL